MVSYPLRWLAQAGITDATVCANSAARGVRELVQGTVPTSLKVDFTEDWMPRGAAGCVRDATLRTGSHTLVVVDGTTIPQSDLDELIATHRREKAALTVSVRSEHRGGPGSFLSPNGVYILDRRALDYIADQGFQDIKEVLVPKLHAAGEHIAFHACVGRSPRIFDAESYLSVNRWAISRLRAPEHAADMSKKGYHQRGEAFVHMSSRVSPRARLVGPLVIGRGATIEDQATLIGPAAIGQGAHVSNGAVVSRSVLWGQCRLGRESLVDGCLVSDGVQVPARSSRYRVLEMGRSRTTEVPLPGSWTFSRVQGWIQSVLPPTASGAPTPARGHRYPEASHVDRAVALGRSRS